MVHLECQVSCTMPPPPHIWAHPHDQSLQPLYHYFYNELYNKSRKIYICYNVFPGNMRPNRGPPAQTSSNSDSFTCTSMAIATSSGGNQSIGDPGICRVTQLGVWGDSTGPCRQSTPITVASESNCGSSYASPSDPSMTVPPSIWLHFFLRVSLSGPIFTLLSPLGLSVHGMWLGVLHLLFL